MNARSFHLAPLLGAILLALGPMAVAQTTPDAGSLATHVENADRFKGVGKVVMASCGVYVLREFDAGSSSQGGSTRGSIAMTSANLKVVGLEPARLQALSEQLCAQAAESVRARGIAVVELPAEGGSPAVAAWRGAGEAAPLEFDAAGGKGSIYSPKALPLLHVSEMGWLHRNSGGLFGGPKVDDDYVSLGGKMGVGFQMTKLQPLLRDLAADQQAPLLHVRLVLAPGSVTASQGGFFASASETKSSSGLLMPALTNRLLLTTGSGDVARVSLDKPLIAQQGFGEIADVTSTAETAGNIALAAFSILSAASGHGRAVINNSRKQELRADPDLFDAVAKAQATVALNALAARLGAP